MPPPLKWAGGKRWQVPHLEPFAGGLAVALGLSPAQAILNDINPHLISFYGWLRRGLKITIPLENDETLFYEHRKRFNALLGAGRGTSKEAASLFYFLNRTGYNGLCRFNRSGEFNVPFVANYDPTRTDTLFFQDLTKKALQRVWPLQSADFWTSYVLTAYKPDSRLDKDPNIEGSTTGRTSVGTGLTALFLEPVAESRAIAAQPLCFEPGHILAHEVVHGLGVEGHLGTELMSENCTTAYAPTLSSWIIRKLRTSPFVLERIQP